jgi:cephalosporin hydroxylase
MKTVVFDRQGSVLDYWHARIRQHHDDSYRGRAMAKLPEDLWTYSHLIWDSQPSTILEFGSWAGGSALWFADQLEMLVDGGGLVVTVDTLPINPPLDDPRIVVIEGNLHDQQIVDLVHQQVRPGRTMVVEDSAHDHQTTAKVLSSYSDLVASSFWLVVEDGFVDDPDLCRDQYHSRGVLPAIDEFLRSPAGDRFERRDAIYGVTSNVGGWLQAVR